MTTSHDAWMQLGYIMCGSSKDFNQVRLNDPRMKTLFLRYPISAGDIHELCLALRCNTYIHTIDFTHVKLGDSVVELAKTLQTSRSVGNLILASSALTKMSFEALADMLRHNTSILKLNLYNSRSMGMDANYVMSVIAKALEVNQTLTELDIRSNRVGHLGMVCLADALRRNDTLISVKKDDFFFNGSESIRIHGVDRIDSLLFANRRKQAARGLLSAWVRAQRTDVPLSYLPRELAAYIADLVRAG